MGEKGRTKGSKKKDRGLKRRKHEETGVSEQERWTERRRKDKRRRWMDE